MPVQSIAWNPEETHIAQCWVGHPRNNYSRWNSITSCTITGDNLDEFYPFPQVTINRCKNLKRLRIPTYSALVLALRCMASRDAMQRSARTSAEKPRPMGRNFEILQRIVPELTAASSVEMAPREHVPITSYAASDTGRCAGRPRQWFRSAIAKIRKCRTVCAN